MRTIYDIKGQKIGAVNSHENYVSLLGTNLYTSFSQGVEYQAVFRFEKNMAGLIDKGYLLELHKGDAGPHCLLLDKLGAQTKLRSWGYSEAIVEKI